MPVWSVQGRGFYFPFYVFLNPGLSDPKATHKEGCSWTVAPRAPGGRSQRHSSLSTHWTLPASATVLAPGSLGQLAVANLGSLGAPASVPAAWPMSLSQRHTTPTRPGPAPLTLCSQFIPGLTWPHLSHTPHRAALGKPSAVDSHPSEELRRQRPSKWHPLPRSLLLWQHQRVAPQELPNQPQPLWIFP